MSAILTTDCSRCRATHMTFDILGDHKRYDENGYFDSYETLAICRGCSRGSILILTLRSDAQFESDVPPLANFITPLANVFMIEPAPSTGISAEEAPEDVPPEIAGAFSEGAMCIEVGCFNAACAMFRLALDLATKALLPPPGEVHEGLKWKTRRDLGLRLDWLFENQKLSVDLQPLAVCIKDHGNDGAHDGTLEQIDALDMKDFTTALLRRLYSEPAQLSRAINRRTERHAKAKA